MAAWVYILKCADGSYYVGCTTAFDLRMDQHHRSKRGYTSSRLPVECVYAAETEDVRDAIEWERKLKRWTRAKKEAVISGAFDQLPGLSRSRQHHPRP